MQEAALKPDMVMAGITLLVFIETMLVAVSLFLFFRSKGRTYAESLASGMILTLMGISLFHQGILVAGIGRGSIFLELLMVAGSGVIGWRNRGAALRIPGELPVFLAKIPTAVWLLLAVSWGYMALLAVYQPVMPHHRLVLETVDLAAQGQQAMPANAVMISRQLWQYHDGRGLNMFGFMGYLVIVVATYALGRRYAWVPISFTVALVVGSLPRFVFHSISPGFEIIPAAASLSAVLFTFRLIELPSLTDLGLFLCSVCFVSSDGPVSLFMAAILLALCLLLVFRRHGTTVMLLIRKNWVKALAFLLPAAWFARPWIYFRDPVFRGFETNNAEMLGGLANAVRYLFQAMDVSYALEPFFRDTLGVSLISLIQGGYDRLFAPFFGQKGAVEAFRLVSLPNDQAAGFGPLGFLLIGPGVLYALVKGPRRLKAVAVAMIGFLYLLTLIPAWKSDNIAYFSYFYAGTGFCLAFMLPPWRLGNRVKWAIQITSLIFFTYSLLHI